MYGPHRPVATVAWEEYRIYITLGRAASVRWLRREFRPGRSFSSLNRTSLVFLEFVHWHVLVRKLMYSTVPRHFELPFRRFETLERSQTHFQMFLRAR